MEEDILFYKKYNTAIKAKLIYVPKNNEIITEPDYRTHFTLMIGSAQMKCRYLTVRKIIGYASEKKNMINMIAVLGLWKMLLFV